MMSTLKNLKYKIQNPLKKTLENLKANFSYSLFMFNRNLNFNVPHSVRILSSRNLSDLCCYLKDLF